jgi:hypothetical protein
MIRFALIVALLTGPALVLSGEQTRKDPGPTDAPTVDLDMKTLCSTRFQLVGRPDRLFLDGALIIRKEWKSSEHMCDSRRIQVAIYLRELGIACELEMSEGDGPHQIVIYDDRGEALVRGHLAAWEGVVQA